jgi:hypothetical protein
MKRLDRGATLAELLIVCALFSVFMTVSVGLFTSMTRVVGREQKPVERMMQGRVAVLKIARRIRNCNGLVAPKLRQLLDTPTDSLMLKDQVLAQLVDIHIDNGILRETYYPLHYDPESPQDIKPFKIRRLTPARSFQISSGGVQHPTRIVVEITLADGREVRAVSNFREAL